MLKHGILGLLNYHEMTGYEIMLTFRDSLNFFWQAQTSQIYRELGGLEKQNWVSNTLIKQQGKPDKKVYAITQEGKTELLRWLADGGLKLNPRSLTLMKVFFMGERSKEENICCFQKFKEECEQYLESMKPVEGYIEAYGNVIGDKEKTLYWQMTLDFGRRNIQCFIDWIQSCIERLEETE